MLKCFRGWPCLLAAMLMFMPGVAVRAWTVSAGVIRDAAGAPVTLRGVNWSGFETDTFSPHGLWKRSLGSMLDQIKALGFNALRLPVCPLTLHGATPQGIDYALNPQLLGLNSLQLLDELVNQAQRRGLMFMLDQHRSDCESVSELWYTPDYGEAQWMADLAFMAARYADRWAFLGLDLEGAPHGEASWGSNDPQTDWRLAAQHAAHAVLAVAPDTLVFVGGVGAGRSCSAAPLAAWWGGNVAPQSCAPLDIPSDRLVLAPRVYGPDVQMQPYFSDGAFPLNMPAIWDADFGHVHDLGQAVVIAEVGGDYGRRVPADKLLQQQLFAYLKRRGMHDLFYWTWNADSGDTGGVLDDDWSHIRDDKLELLHDFWDLPQPAIAWHQGR